MIPFAYHTIERIRGVKRTDAGNTEYVDWADPDILVINNVNVQPMIIVGGQSSERETAQRDMITDRLRVFAPPDSDIRAEDRIRYQGVVYSVEGEPMRHPSWFSSSANHMEVSLRVRYG